MHKFPTKENEILALAGKMIYGFQRHAGDFPSVNRYFMYFKKMFYKMKKKAQAEALSKLRIAAKAKRESLDSLKELMKSCLKKSEVDCANDPLKLTEIGWAIAAAAETLAIPGPPKNLTATACDDNGVSLEWERPADGGGRVSCYILQRRQMQFAGGFGDWEMIEFCYDNQLTVKNQPAGANLEYRITASNPAGQSLPSNTVSIVL